MALRSVIDLKRTFTLFLPKDSVYLEDHLQIKSSFWELEPWLATSCLSPPPSFVFLLLFFFNTGSHMSQASLEQASYIVKDDLKVDLPASVFKVSSRD